MTVDAHLFLLLASVFLKDDATYRIYYAAAYYDNAI